jgi:hypothetical protein
MEGKIYDITEWVSCKVCISTIQNAVTKSSNQLNEVKVCSLNEPDFTFLILVNKDNHQFVTVAD